MQIKSTYLPLTKKFTGVIVRFDNDRMGARMMSMGIRPGQFIRIVRKAPFGGAFYIKVNGQFFGLRKNEAASILVK